MKRLYHRPYFFDQGIHFECRQCGACCTGDPGIVYVDKREAMHMAEYLSTAFSFFIDKYLYPLRAGYGIREHSDGRCFFYDNGCTIYPVRPHQCRTYPFWFENLRSIKKWRRVSEACPGIGCGDLHPKEEILKIIHSTMDAAVRSYIADNE
ncbi:MAG: YkgJ family cysteine cluster protein [Desulfobacterales bacterium]